MWKNGQNEAEHSTWMLLLTGKTVRRRCGAMWQRWRRSNNEWTRNSYEHCKGTPHHAIRWPNEITSSLAIHSASSSATNPTVSLHSQSFCLTKQCQEHTLDKCQCGREKGKTIHVVWLSLDDLSLGHHELRPFSRPSAQPVSTQRCVCVYVLAQGWGVCICMNPSWYYNTISGRFEMCLLKDDMVKYIVPTHTNIVTIPSPSPPICLYTVIICVLLSIHIFWLCI